MTEFFIVSFTNYNQSFTKKSRLLAYLIRGGFFLKLILMSLPAGFEIISHLYYSRFKPVCETEN
jgi:hypothetical protein